MTSFLPPILICVLGPFQVLAAGRPLALRNSSKAAALLGQLALHPNNGLGRDALVERLWPTSLVSHAYQSLTSLIYSLHHLIGDALDGAPLVSYAHGAYQLNIDAGVVVDAQTFEALVQTGEQLAGVGERTAAGAIYQQALSLYRGDLCLGDGLSDLVAREHLRARHLTLLAWLANERYVAGEYASCLEHAGRLLGHDPCREDAHRLVMRCHVRMGERAQAVRQYRLCAALVNAGLDAEPEPATTALFAQVCRDPASI